MHSRTPARLYGTLVARPLSLPPFSPLSTDPPPLHNMSPLIGPVPVAEVRRHKKYRLPSVLMRSGTSRGLFLHRHHLPVLESEWGPILTSAMGSRNGDQRQLEGVGGATSTTSKVVVVSKSRRPNIDVEYTFVQVAVGQEIVDMTGNCGNMASGIGAFALDEGLVEAAPGQTEASTTSSSSPPRRHGSKRTL